jgi:hypothetical protein
MKKMVGLVVIVFVIAWAVTGFAQTNLTVVRHPDNTLWEMTCDGISNCSAWTKIGGGFTQQPTLMWDPTIQKYILIGIGNNLSNIWRSTFNADGTWNNDWLLIGTGATGSPSPVATAANFGYVSTVLVGPVGTATQNGTALLNAMAGITTASSTNPYLLKIEPGIYDIGTSSLQMKQYVDVEGSGENTTVITGHIDSNTSGVLQGASHAEIRFLTVQNTGGGTYAIAIYNTSASPKITNVTASASGGGVVHTGVHNEGVYNESSSSPTMTNVTISASGATTNYGVLNYSSSPTMTNGTISASGGGGSANYGVFNNISNSTMTNGTVTASGGTSSINNGVWNHSSSPTMTNVTISASGTTTYGVASDGSGTIMINNSVIIGLTMTIYNDINTTTRVGNSKLAGGPVSTSGTTTCAGVYDENYTFYASTCP